MKYNFDKIVDRVGTGSVKWDGRKELGVSDDVLPLWIADMDFEVPSEVESAISERLKHAVFGYTITPESYFEAVVGWYRRHYGYELPREWIQPVPGVVPGIVALLDSMTQPGDEVIIQTPVYPQFSNAIRNVDCMIVENPLREEDGYYTMDYEQLESVITARTKALILCNPHNPVGRAWKEDELRKLGEICNRHGVTVISDEIHSDIVFKPHQHFIYAALGDDFARNSVMCTAPNKTFNIAGFKTGNFIFHDSKRYQDFSLYMEKHFMGNHTILGNIAQAAVYVNGDEWYQEMMSYVRENLKYAVNYFKSEIPEIQTRMPEATYLLWLDCRALNLRGAELQRFFLEECKVFFNEGYLFGSAYDTHLRMNLATRRSIIEEALDRIRQAVKRR